MSQADGIPFRVEHFRGKNVDVTVDAGYVDFWISAHGSNFREDELPGGYHLACHLKQAWAEIERLQKVVFKLDEAERDARRRADAAEEILRHPQPLVCPGDESIDPCQACGARLATDVCRAIGGTEGALYTRIARLEEALMYAEGDDPDEDD